MDFLDYYKILGLEKTATPTEIKSAYRKLARKYHPDLNPDDQNANKNFQQINEANAVLSDPIKRSKYDQYGKDWQHADEFKKSYQYREQSSDEEGQRNYHSRSGRDFSDFFESMFGPASNGGRKSQSTFRGEDFQTELHLELTDAYKTHKQTLSVNGKMIRITIPAGIEHGQIIKVPGHGGQGINGGPGGDLFIRFSISNHSEFRRQKNNLHITVNLDLYKAVLGGEIILDTLDGKVKLKVKPETQNGSKVKLTGKGFPVYKKEGQFGDLYVTYSIKIPTDLTEKQKQLFTELSGSA